MSAAELRKAASTLRERANAATPGEWLRYGTSIGVTVKGCTCAGPIPHYPQHESYCGTDGPVIDASEPDIAYIATVQPGVGLALAEWLDTAGADLWAYGPLCECGSGCNDCDDSLWEPHVRRALTLARLINGGAS